jgi:hypothetical protein
MPTCVPLFDVVFPQEYIDNLKANEMRLKEENKQANEKDDVPDILGFESVEPYYNADRKSHVIDFTEHSNFISSSKNFQVKWKGKSDLVMELVKVDKNVFEMSVRWPISIMTAFALAVTVFDPQYY